MQGSEGILLFGQYFVKRLGDLQLQKRPQLIVYEDTKNYIKCILVKTHYFTTILFNKPEILHSAF